MSASVFAVFRLPSTNDGTSLVSSSRATKRYWSPDPVVRRLFPRQPALLLQYEGPDFIALQMRQGEIPHPPVQEVSAAIADAQHEPRYTWCGGRR